MTIEMPQPLDVTTPRGGHRGPVGHAPTDVYGISLRLDNIEAELSLINLTAVYEVLRDIKEKLAAIDESSESTKQSEASEPANDQWLDTDTVANILGVTSETVRRLTRKGLLRGHKVTPGSTRSKWLYTERDIEAYWRRSQSKLKPARTRRTPKRTLELYR